MRYLFSLVLIIGSLVVARAERLPTEVFARPLAFSRMTLSRDGQYVAYTAEFESEERVFIRNVEKDGKVLGVDVPALGPNLFGRIGSIAWISSKRLLVGSSSGYIAIDRDGKDYGYLTGYARIYRMDRQDNEQLQVNGLIHVDADRDNDRVLFAEYDQVVQTPRSGWIPLRLPNVISMDTRSSLYSRELENPGDVLGWIADRQGVIRAGVRLKDKKQSIIYRENEKAAWRTLGGLPDDNRSFAALGLNDKGTELYVSKVGTNGLSALYTYNLAENKLGELILSHELYDIGPSNGTRLIHAAEGRLLGVRYMTEMPRVLWLDPNLASIQHQIDLALPNAVNVITSITNNEQEMLVISTSARNPGTYYLFDRAKGSLGKFVDAAPWVQPEKMAETLPLKITSRDGLKLHGYITVPLGREMKNLPLVVMPHGGPWARDTYGYDPQVQFLANRGYAVLKINYRGSTGYGHKFYEAGFKVVGTKMQDDIEDATRWAIGKGIADPKRVAIMGGSFGGYSTLMGLIRSPDLYCCGVDIAGVTDWDGVIKYSAEMNPDSYAFEAEMIGDPKTEAAMLQSISPAYHAEKILSPLLIVHGRDDPVVPYDQTKMLTAAMDKAGRPYELMAKYNEPHGIFNYKNRIELYDRVEAFLAKHMPADKPAVASK